jgi:hypothetical protein
MKERQRRGRTTRDGELLKESRGVGMAATKLGEDDNDVKGVVEVK